jgi:hypothetical protein
LVKRKAKCIKVGGIKMRGIRKILPQRRANSAFGARIKPTHSTFHKETHRSIAAKDLLTGLGLFRE